MTSLCHILDSIWEPKGKVVLYEGLFILCDRVIPGIPFRIAHQLIEFFIFQVLYFQDFSLDFLAPKKLEY